MTNQDTPRFARLMTILSAVFNEEVTDARIEAYFTALADLDIVDVEVGGQYLIRHSKWFPKPAELAQTVQDESDLVSEVSFFEMKREVSREGWTGCPNLPDDTMRVIQLIWGSWRELCATLPADGPELLAWEKRFRETYKGVVKRKEVLAIREGALPELLS